MSTNLEIEAKALLTKADYDKLIARFGSENIYKQINYYIDSDNRDIISKKCGLRIRTIGDENELTLKIPSGDGKLEINQQISSKSLNLFISNNVFPNGEVKDYITANLGIDSTTLKCLGELVTYRFDIKKENCQISIDKSQYHSITDYEVECEADSMDKAISELKEFLNKFGIEYKKSPKSKLRRFLDTL